MTKEKKDIKDYLHLYLGCSVAIGYKYPDGMRIDVIAGVSKNGIYTSNEDFCSSDQFKLLLRPLSDMTEEECIVLGWSSSYQCAIIKHKPENLQPNEILFLLKNAFDLFELIQSGLAIDKTKINQ